MVRSLDRGRRGALQSALAAPRAVGWSVLVGVGVCGWLHMYAWCLSGNIKCTAVCSPGNGKQEHPFIVREFYDTPYDICMHMFDCFVEVCISCIDPLSVDLDGYFVLAAVAYCRISHLCFPNTGLRFPNTGQRRGVLRNQPITVCRE